MISIRIFFQQKKYLASASLFACFSLIFSTWVTYIPHIAEKLNITEGKIGSAIFFSAFGAFFMIRICRHIIERVGVGKYTFIAFTVYAMCLFGPFLANTYTTLCISLFIFGMASSSFAISLNSLTATIEKQDGVYIMSGSHGFWSIGGVIGASTGSLIAALLKNPILHISILVLILLSYQFYMHSEYKYRIGENIVKEKKKSKNFVPLFVIAAVGLIIMVSEGAIADWSALYLKKIIHINIKFIGFGYAAFASAMMIGRFTGDFLSRKFGSWQLLTYSSLIGVLGFCLVLVINPLISIIGFFIVGIGFSVIVPEVYRLASKVEGIKTSEGVSFIAATVNIGFLLGPVFLGYLAELKSLHLSLIVLTFFVSLAFVIAYWKQNRVKV
jgi:fucose permease